MKAQGSEGAIVKAQASEGAVVKVQFSEGTIVKAQFSTLRVEIKNLAVYPRPKRSMTQ